MTRFDCFHNHANKLSQPPILSIFCRCPQSLPASFDKHRDALRDLFEWVVPPLIVLINKFCRTVLPSSTYLTGMQPVTTLLQLMSAQLEDFWAEKFKDTPDHGAQVWALARRVCVWSIARVF